MTKTAEVSFPNLRSVQRNQLRAEVGNKGMQAAWSERKAKEKANRIKAQRKARGKDDKATQKTRKSRISLFKRIANWFRGLRK